MSLRPEQPEPFIRGAPYPASAEVAYPRANPTDTARLPADIWHAATVPAGVRIELIGDAQAIDVAYRTTTGNLGYRGDGAGIVFSVWRARPQGVRGGGRARRRAHPPHARIVVTRDAGGHLSTRRHAPGGPLPDRGQGRDRARTGAPPLDRLRRLDDAGMDRVGTLPGMGGDRGTQDRPRPGQPRVRGRGPRRDRLGRAHRGHERRHHHHRVRGELLDADTAQHGDGRGGLREPSSTSSGWTTRRRRSWS